MEDRRLSGPEHREMAALVPAESLINILGVVYVHRKTSDGGDIYLTKFGLPCVEFLELENWYEEQWFTEHRERLQGTSAVFRVPTKEINGRSLELVVKNCRVGEHVPLETKTLIEFINAEFNSPWEEFALVMEMREGRYGPADVLIRTQLPLAIYVPPEKMQMWQSGRSHEKINRIAARHPGIDLDILRQYKMIYGWIRGKSVVQILSQAGSIGASLDNLLSPLTTKAIADMNAKGFVVADMKPDHIIIGEAEVNDIGTLAASSNKEEKAGKAAAVLNTYLKQGEYWVIDYELLMRTEDHEEQVSYRQRRSYHDDQKDRWVPTELPPHLRLVECLGVPYIFGHTESTGGRLWVVGRNARLFDYYLPERWRKTHAWKLSENNEVFYTFTKDHVHIVWKTSRVGETPGSETANDRRARNSASGFNSPFEEFAIAHFLSQNGVPTVYARAIYVTGSTKLEPTTDRSRYESHAELVDPNGELILRDDRNYITIRGYFNGPDSWVAEQHGLLCRPMDLRAALERGVLSREDCLKLYDAALSRLKNIGYDGSLLEANDMLVAFEPGGSLLRDEDNQPQIRICNFELLQKI